jgi:uncharacterized tellurite resistance protein B-like protein
MDVIAFQRRLLVHALHVIACDGDVDPMEIKELRSLTSSSPHFSELEVERELAESLEALRAGGPAAIESALQELGRETVPRRMALRLLDVLLQVIHADGRVHDSERQYLQRAREALGIPLGEIAMEFPERFAMFVPGSGGAFQAAGAFHLPEALPDASEFFAPN